MSEVAIGFVACPPRSPSRRWLTMVVENPTASGAPLDLLVAEDAHLLVDTGLLEDGEGRAPPAEDWPSYRPFARTAPHAAVPLAGLTTPVGASGEA
jgi:hypothetical protein